MHTPAIHVHRLKLARDARLKDFLGYGGGDTVAVIDDKKAAKAALARACNKNMGRMGVAGIANHLADRILNILDVVLGLTALSLRDA